MATPRATESAAAAALTATRDLFNASSDEHDQMMSTIVVIDKYITPVWYVVGVPGNLLAFFVWTQRKMRASSGCYLAALALNDCIFLLLQVNFSASRPRFIIMFCYMLAVLFEQNKKIIHVLYTFVRYMKHDSKGAQKLQHFPLVYNIQRTYKYCYY